MATVLGAGDHFGRYVIERILGSGAFGVVYCARDTFLDRDVALKLLQPQIAIEGEDRQRFLNEARALASLHHANIVTVYDLGSEGEQPYFTMQLLRGQTLAALLRAHGARSYAEAARLMAGLCAAVDHLHAARLVHRDLKPANVMVSDDGVATLLDFGVARALGRTQLTQTGYSIGTLEYAAPEQVRGERVGPEADIYALGVLAYQMLCGQPPFTGEAAYVVYATVHQPAPPIETRIGGLSPQTYAAVNAALAKEPAQRPASASALFAGFSGAQLPTYQPQTRVAPPSATVRQPVQRRAPLARPDGEMRRTERLRAPVAELERFRFFAEEVSVRHGSVRGTLIVTDNSVRFEPRDQTLTQLANGIAFSSIETIGRTHHGRGFRSALVLHLTSGRALRFANFADGVDANVVIEAITSMM